MKPVRHIPLRKTVFKYLVARLTIVNEFPHWYFTSLKVEVMDYCLKIYYDPAPHALRFKFIIRRYETNTSILHTRAFLNQRIIRTEL
jgi:hypothetical protein